MIRVIFLRVRIELPPKEAYSDPPLNPDNHPTNDFSDNTFFYVYFNSSNKYLNYSSHAQQILTWPRPVSSLIKKVKSGSGAQITTRIPLTPDPQSFI